MNKIYDCVTYDPAILAGKPIIRGTRITVELILKMLAQGQKQDDILEEYPDLNALDVLASSLFATHYGFHYQN